MIRCNQITSGGSLQTITLADVPSALSDPNKSIWVSLEMASIDEITSVLADTFHFHPLSIEDCISDGYQTAKVDDFESYLFIIANAIKPQEEIRDIETLELNIFLGTNFVVTCYTSAQMPPVEHVLRRVSRDTRLLTHGSDFLCHALLDNLVDEYMPHIDEMETEIGLLEDSVLERPNPETLQRLISLKHSIMSLRRVITPLREVVNRLTRDEYPQIQSQNRIYFRDIYDHLVWILDISDTIRDIASGAMDIYLNSTSLRLNEVMKALTIVSTIFLPLSFVTGIFGMNFVQMPGLSSPFGFWIMCVIFVLLAAGMILFFKKRGWF